MFGGIYFAGAPFAGGGSDEATAGFSSGSQVATSGSSGYQVAAAASSGEPTRAGTDG